jgi:hypothetical protein
VEEERLRREGAGSRHDRRGRPAPHEAPSPAPADTAGRKGADGHSGSGQPAEGYPPHSAFYEDKGLIEPVRVGNTRVYSRKEVARMHLILRGKHLGFTIREIKEFLDLYDADPQHVEQSRLLLKRINERLRLLESSVMRWTRR